MATARAFLAGMFWINSDEFASIPSQFVFEHSVEFAPALVEDGAVESGFLPDICARILDGAFGRFRHVADFEILNDDQCVVAGQQGG